MCKNGKFVDDSCEKQKAINQNCPCLQSTFVSKTNFDVIIQEIQIYPGTFLTKLELLGTYFDNRNYEI